LGKREVTEREKLSYLARKLPAGVRETYLLPLKYSPDRVQNPQGKEGARGEGEEFQVLIGGVGVIKTHGISK